jgi:predicted nucleotidyltransferase
VYSIKTYLYGSVAFKTYLPDGDIDISVFEDLSSNDENQLPWYTKVKSVFKSVQENANSSLDIRDIYFINAEVCANDIVFYHHC